LRRFEQTLNSIFLIEAGQKLFQNNATGHLDKDVLADNGATEHYILRHVQLGYLASVLAKPCFNRHTGEGRYPVAGMTFLSNKKAAHGELIVYPEPAEGNHGA
jgi:hypothetical protein